MNTDQGHLNCYKGGEFSGVYYYTNFERNQSRTVTVQMVGHLAYLVQIILIFTQKVKKTNNVNEHVNQKTIENKNQQQQ